MTGFAGRSADAALLARIRAGQVGGVILFGGNVGPTDADTARLVARLQQAAAAGGNPPLLVAVDQEGGAVKRFPEAPPTLSAAAMGRDGSAARARAEGAAAGAYLRNLGIDVDLAPVLDAPDSPDSFLGSRAFSDDPKLNAKLGSAFAAGLQSRRVAATAKHFPGLGAARANTDERAVVVSAPRDELDRGLTPFAAAVAHGVKLVMVANAAYRPYSGRTPAVLSRKIVTGLLRRQLDFGGVVISDALETPATSGRSPAEAAGAGVDVLLYTNESDAATAYRALLDAAKRGEVPTADLKASAARIAALKHWLG